MLWINELNNIAKDSPLVISGWNELQDNGFSIELDLKGKKILDMRGISDSDFIQLLWSAGMLSLASDALLQQIESHLNRGTHRPKGIAIDSNIILNRFLMNYKATRITGPQTPFRGIVLVAQASSHEFHYKAGFSMAGDPDTVTILHNHLKTDSNLCKLLTNVTDANQTKPRLKKLKSFSGRLGLKGFYELRQLETQFPVLQVTVLHPYYSAPFAVHKNVDALFDSLIRLELNYLTKSTNLDLIFLTMDKDQHECALTEGLQSLYIPFPSAWTDLLEPAPQYLTLENIAALTFGLLFFSPYITLKTQTREIHYAFFWVGKKPEENLGALIRKLPPGGPIEPLSML